MYDVLIIADTILKIAKAQGKSRRQYNSSNCAISHMDGALCCAARGYSAIALRRGDMAR